MYCFVFKQKTAYEMRISDWSSDVCSSDLAVVDIRPFQPAQSAGLDEALIVILVRIVTHHVEGATEFGALFDGPALVRLLQTVDAQFHRASVPLHIDRKSTRLNSSH